MQLDELHLLRGNTPLAWEDWRDGAVERPDQIPDGSTRAILKRVKASHKGISERRTLRELVVYAVNQDFLDEICALTDLEFLDLNYPVTAEDISGIARLTKLNTLKMDSVRKVTDFTPALALPKLHTLMIAHAKHLDGFDFLRDAHHLKVIGLEGSMWTTQKVESLKPLAGLQNLEALFMTSTRLVDKELSYLAECPKLRILQCARFAPKEQFERLRKLMPQLRCQWCDKYELE